MHKQTINWDTLIDPNEAAFLTSKAITGELIQAIQISIAIMSANSHLSPLDQEMCRTVGLFHAGVIAGKRLERNRRR